MENELRIGNLVFDVWTNQVCEVDGILINGDVVTLDSTYDSGYRNMSEKPIPLTEEWLKRLGFTYCGAEGYSHDMKSTLQFYFSTRNGLLCNLFYRRTIESDKVKGCFFVHEFQNLFFALTGQELEIKKVN